MKYPPDMPTTAAEYLKRIEHARLLMREKNHLSALEILENLHQEAPERYSPLFLKALCHSELEHIYDCEQAFQKCLTLHPHKVDARYCYAMFLADQKYFRDAVAQFHQCITDGHDTYDLHLYLACAYIQLEDDFQNVHKHLNISLQKRLTWGGIRMLFKMYEILFWKKIFGA